MAQGIGYVLALDGLGYGQAEVQTGAQAVMETD